MNRKQRWNHKSVSWCDGKKHISHESAWLIIAEQMAERLPHTTATLVKVLCALKISLW